MGILNRLLLLPYAILGMALAVAVAAAVLRILPESIWLNELRYALSRQELLIGCAVYFLFSLKFFFAVFSRFSSSTRTDGEFMVIETPAGSVQVALPAVQGIVERTTLAMQEVREAAAVIVVHDEQRKDSADPPMHIELKISIADHAALGQVTEQLTQSVQQHIHEVLGVAEVPVKISVTEIGASGAAKRSVA